MSAANATIPSHSLEAERRSHEPSMEEILASIRRIIADDGNFPVLRRDKEKDERRPATGLPAEPEAPSVASGEPEPVEDAPLREPETPFPAHSAPASKREASVVALQSASTCEAHDFWLRPARRPESASPPFATRDEARVEASRSWVDEADDAVVEDGYDVEDHEAENGEPVGEETAADAHEIGAPLVSADAAASVASHFHALAASMVLSESDLISRYAQEMLRPMLKQWLDDNLPVLVERLVRAEIERVARGRRS